MKTMVGELGNIFGEALLVLVDWPKQKSTSMDHMSWENQC